MKQKIVILVMSYHTINFFKKIIKRLQYHGHEVRILAKYELPFGAKEDKFDTHRCNWDKFEWDRITEFEPDTILVFNGYFRPIHAATSVLKTLYRVLLAEVAWFPQNDFIYIDKGVHHNSTISETVELEMARTDLGESIEKYRGHLNELKDFYERTQSLLTKPAEIEDGKINVVIPLQLERDTSILYASPYFKDMGSLIGFVSNNLSKANIIVKCHPKLSTDELEEKIGPGSFPGVKFVIETPHYMNDYAKHADMIIGINSTCLMEAKIHNTPVYQLGCNIMQRKANPPHKKELQDFYLSVVQGNHKENVQANEVALLTMLANQIDFRNPPEWANELVVCDATPRTMENLDER